jgi:hypothetical protein
VEGSAHGSSRNKEKKNKTPKKETRFYSGKEEEEEKKAIGFSVVQVEGLAIRFTRHKGRD